MAKTTTSKVWHGSASLRRSLVEIASLEPWPGNARRGDVEAVRASLRRFGQVRPILVYERRIVAGHHVVLAATEEGWTHVAATEHEFDSEEEARAYLLADNRIPELGRYEDDLLGAQLLAVQASEKGLTGTGYTADYVADLDAKVREMFAPSQEAQPRLDQRNAPEPSLGFEVRIYPGDRRTEFARHVALLKHEWGTTDTTAVVVRAVEEAARAANQ